MIDNALTYNITTEKFDIKDKEDSRLAVLKDLIKDHNAHESLLFKKYGIEPKFMRISIMGRGHRRDFSKPYVGPYGRIRHPKFHSNADCNLQHRFAEWFEVYVHLDSSRIWRVKNV